MCAALLPVAAVGDSPMVASSLAGARCAATIEAIGSRFVQSQGAGTLATLVVVPSTTTFEGSGVFTTDALPSMVSVALADAVPPRKRLPRTVPPADSLRLPGVARSPPMVHGLDHACPRSDPTLPPAPPSGAPRVPSNPSVTRVLLALIAPHEQMACVKVACARMPVQLDPEPPSSPVVGSPPEVQAGPASPASKGTLSTP